MFHQEGSFIICVKCFKNGNYGENKSAGDFKFIDCIQNSGNHEAAWTEAETLILLESVLKHGDDWDLIAENVKTKTKADCISKLIQLPFGDLMLGSAHRNGRLWENDGNLSVVKQGQVASSESHSEENVKGEDQCEDVKNESNQNGDAENQVPPLKRKRTTSPSDTGNSLMQQVKSFSILFVLQNLGGCSMRLSSLFFFKLVFSLDVQRMLKNSNQNFVVKNFTDLNIKHVNVKSSCS